MKWSDEELLQRLDEQDAQWLLKIKGQTVRPAVRITRRGEPVWILQDGDAWDVRPVNPDTGEVKPPHPDWPRTAW